MICDHCNDGDDPTCLNCDGSGTICDHCGEAADRGAALCEDCYADRMAISNDDDGSDPWPHHMRIANRHEVTGDLDITDDDEDGVHAQD